MSNDHKSILVGDSQGRAKGYSQEELLSRKMNSWQGWQCAASVENIYINADGNIYSATCKQNGMLGSINDNNFGLPESWIKCEKKWCMCGTDMMLRKVKEHEQIPKTYETPAQEITEDPTEPSWVAPYHVESHKEFPKIVTWDLGRRCNYSCDYCNPSISNNYEAHKSWGTLKHGADSVFRNFCKGVPSKFVFTGGEPTINPSFMDLVKYIRDNGHIIHTQTNGGRNGKYFSELIGLSSVGVSVHLDFVDDDRLLEMCQTVLNRQKEDRDSGLNWFGIRIMVAPGNFERALKLYVKIKDLQHFDEIGNLFMSTLYSTMDASQHLEYDPVELQKIQTMA